MTDFLRDVLVDAIHLVAINPHTRATQGRYFGTDHAAAWQWARDHNTSGENIYYTINRTRPVDKKCSKVDILTVRFAQVDIDPTGVPSEWDKGAALADLVARGNPSIVVDTGNGLQALWRLTASPADVEQINRGITAIFGADNCHNLDRVFRLPDTINYPSASKQARGYVITASSLLLATPATYDPEALRAHWPAPTSAAAQAASGEAEVGDWEVLGADDLDPPATPVLRRLLETDNSDRSGQASKVATAMGHAGYSNEAVMGIMMNPDWPWSGTIFDQRDPERQARRKVYVAQQNRPDPTTIFPPIPPADLPTTARAEPPEVTTARDTGYALRNGTSLSADNQMQLFKGCVYVESLDAVLCPDGEIRKQAQFNKRYGGYRYETHVDGGSGSPSKSAWEGFTENPRFFAPTVQALCFRPEHPPGAMVTDGSRKLVNTYVPIKPVTRSGDPAPFLTHIAKLLPNERDQEILLTYMASCLQHPGMKAQWWPVIQGCQGNGKSLLLNVMEFCVTSQYFHLPNAAKMTRSGIDFNAWIEGRLFVGLEEIYAANRRDFLEEFKPYVTNLRLTIRAMYSAEYTGDNRANGMILTNHTDGVPIDDNTRRYAPFFTAQQSRADMIRDGMGGNYFPDLWAWLRKDGFAIVNGYLRSYACAAEFDPYQGASFAPETSSTASAVRAGLGQAEQEILEAIDQGQPGFCGGWVSSIMLDRLLETKRLNIPRRRRREVMDTLGYVYHPALGTEGRVNDPVMPDNGKPRLYVKKGHLAANFQTVTETCKAYVDAQQRGAQALVAVALGR